MTMPLISSDVAEDYVSTHRPKAVLPPMSGACVARSVNRTERLSTPAAMKAMDKEWSRLRNVKHRAGVGVWDETQVRERFEVVAEARRLGEDYHFARIFDICVEKGAELPEGHSERKFKGRAVLQGDQVKDQNWEAAIFQDLGSSPAAVEASRAADAYGLLPGHSIQVADADQAYTQSYLEGPNKTFVGLPRERWPQSWHDRGFRDPVCPLVLSLYGHPDAGGYWERHCDRILRKNGWSQIADWRSCYWHEACQALLIVYVDDFKMAGPTENLPLLWKHITGDPDAPERGGIYMDSPKSQVRFLGCDHIESQTSLDDGTQIRRIEYDMEPFFKGCLDRWTEVTGQSWATLPHASTPFLDEDVLRKSHNIGPLGYKIVATPSKKGKATRGMNTASLKTSSSSEQVDSEKVPSGVLQPVAASILMQLLYGARFARPDLLRAISYLARKITRWRPMQDQQLFRLVCYVRSTLSFRQFAWIGDKRDQLTLHLFTDADLASDPEDSVSTSGAYFAAVGTHSHVPIAQRSKKQTCVSHSTPEAELVSADHGLRTIGLPALDLWEKLFGCEPKLMMFQDNDACCRIRRSGKNPNTQRVGRTRRISLTVRMF